MLDSAYFLLLKSLKSNMGNLSMWVHTNSKVLGASHSGAFRIAALRNSRGHYSCRPSNSYGTWFPSMHRASEGTPRMKSKSQGGNTLGSQTSRELHGVVTQPGPGNVGAGKEGIRVDDPNGGRGLWEDARYVCTQSTCRFGKVCV